MTSTGGDEFTQAEIQQVVEGLFFQRSAYPFIGVAPPEFLENAATAVATWIVKGGYGVEALYREPVLVSAENVCRRLGDLELYAGTIRRELDHSSPWRASAIVGCLLVGFFSSAKSLLDAGSVGLAVVLQLPLSNKERDFSKTQFWTALRSSGLPALERYEKFRTLIADIIGWRDSAVHRSTPLVFVDSNPGKMANRPPEAIAPGELPIRMPSAPGLDFADLRAANVPMVDPLHKWVEWRPQLLLFAETVCEDLLAGLGRLTRA